MTRLRPDTDSPELTIAGDGVRLTLADARIAFGQVIDILLTRFTPQENQHAGSLFFAGIMDEMINSARPARPGERVLRGQAAQDHVRQAIADSVQRGL